MSKNLLIDIGNSDIKTGLWNTANDKFKFTGRFAYSKFSFERDFKSNFDKLKLNSAVDIDKIGISVLTDRNKKFLVNFFKCNFKKNPVFVKRDLKLPIRISYESSLGNDRICSAAAAVSLFDHKNYLIIDFGTATTYTLILDKVLAGGMIAPGIGTSFMALTQRTSLPAAKLKFPRKFFSKTTADNLKGGVLYQSLYSAERIIYEAAKIYDDLFVISTGGFSKLISKKTDLIQMTDQYLVLKGINFIVSI